MNVVVGTVAHSHYIDELRAVSKGETSVLILRCSLSTKTGGSAIAMDSSQCCIALGIEVSSSTITL